MGTVIVGIILLACISAIVLKMIHDKKSKKSCSGCSSCSLCGSACCSQEKNLKNNIG